MYGPPLRDHRGSELGNVLRILTLYDKVENLLEGAEGRPMGDRAWIAESERELKVNCPPIVFILTSDIFDTELGGRLAG